MNKLMPGILRLDDDRFWSVAFILYYRQYYSEWVDLTHYIEQNAVELSRSICLEGDYIE